MYKFDKEIFEQALNCFLNNKTGAFSTNKTCIYAVTKNAIVVRYYVDARLDLIQDCIAYKTKAGNFLGNSSRLSYVDRSNRAAEEQTIMQNNLLMIPFVVLKQAGLSIDSFTELDKSQDETVYSNSRVCGLTENQKDTFFLNNKTRNVNIEETEDYNKTKRFEIRCQIGRHFTGARLFSCVNETTNVKSVYLMDVDREELKHGIINPFLVNIPDVSVNTIAAAYESLKPAEVKQAEAYERQGEWFFLKALDQVLDESKAIRGELRAGSNRPNHCELFLEVDGKFYVKGTVSHTGREHRDLKLDQWHRALPNTATQSWQITGDID